MKVDLHADLAPAVRSLRVAIDDADRAWGPVQLSTRDARVILAAIEDLTEEGRKAPDQPPPPAEPDPWGLHEGVPEFRPEERDG